MFSSAGNRLVGHCKACIAAAKRARYAADPEKAKTIAKAYYWKNHEASLQTLARYRETHPDIMHTAQGRWESAHTDERREYRQQRYANRTDAEREAAKAKARERYHAKRALYAERHPEIEQERARRHEASLERRRDGYREWRARQGGATIVERVVRAEIIERDKSICYLCNKVLALDDITLDHVVPFSRGGSHTADNVRVACRPCNGAKQDWLVSEM